jgi:hypothetical protein
MATPDNNPDKKPGSLIDLPSAVVGAVAMLGFMYISGGPETQKMVSEMCLNVSCVATAVLFFAFLRLRL